MSTEKEKKTYIFTVLEGEHQGVNKTYRKGDTFESNYPLDTMFVGKFMRGAERVLSDVKKAKPDTRMSFVFSDAEDVTIQFPLAKEHNLHVFKDAMGGHAVAILDEDTEEPINIASTVMGTKQAVNKWLIEYSKQQEQKHD
jgi:hypothetical protein